MIESLLRSNAAGHIVRCTPFNKILEKLFNVTIKPNTPTINKIEKTNNKISDYKNKPKNLLNNEEIKEFESLRKYYKKDINKDI